MSESAPNPEYNESQLSTELTASVGVVVADVLMRGGLPLHVKWDKISFTRRDSSHTPTQSLELTNKGWAKYPGCRIRYLQPTTGALMDVSIGTGFTPETNSFFLSPMSEGIDVTDLAATVLDFQNDEAQVSLTVPGQTPS